MQARKPAWWQLLALALAMFILDAVEHLRPLPHVPVPAVDAGIVVLAFAGMLVWVHLNEGLMERYYLERDESIPTLKITIFEPASTRRRNRYHSHGPVPFEVDSSIDSLDETNVELQEKEKNKWLCN